MKKIFIGNLPWSATEDELTDILSAYGEIHSVNVVLDRETGRSRGFAFAEVDDDAAADLIAQSDNIEIQNRTIRISEAFDRPRGGGGGGHRGGGGGGGHRGGGGGGGYRGGGGGGGGRY